MLLYCISLLFQCKLRNVRLEILERNFIRNLCGIDKNIRLHEQINKKKFEDISDSDSDVSIDNPDFTSYQRWRYKRGDSSQCWHQLVNALHAWRCKLCLSECKLRLVLIPEECQK